MRGGGEPVIVVPADDTTIESINRIVFDGDKVRLEDQHPTWALPSGKKNQREMTIVFDGTLGKLLCYPDGVKGVRPGSSPSAALSQDVPDWVGLPAASPLGYTLRPFAAGVVARTLDQFKSTGAIEIIDGAACLEYSRQDQ